jgi:hypothetical protein
MDELASKQRLRTKKSDKAKEKKGRPSSKHVRQYEKKVRFSLVRIQTQ